MPSLAGGVTVDVPPLGTLALRTHRGPLQVRATVTAVDPDRARALLRSRNPGSVATQQIAADSRDALAEALVRGTVVALLASGVVCAVVFRRRRAVALGMAVVLAGLGASGGLAWATLRTEALNEPKFDGLLAQAPALVGRVRNFSAYSQRVAELTANVARVYSGLATLPAAPLPESTRVLWVSDIHNNPASFELMEELVEQFDVAAIVDTGDIVDVGSTVENGSLARLGTFGVPYLYVRGNHDSRSVTQRFIAGQDGVRVLDDGEVVEVAGVRFAGIGDPLFRPNRTMPGESRAQDALLRQAGERLAAAVEAAEEPVDVVAVHHPKVAEALFGRVPLILDGHTHERRSRVDAGTLELTQGSSGGAGLRTLDGDGEPLDLQMSVLHFDEGKLIAVDDITVGGLGERSVTVERRSPSSYGDASQDAAGAR